MRHKRVIVKFKTPSNELVLDSKSKIRINFTVNKTLSSKPNEANLHIFNLSNSSSKLIGQFGNTVEILAGYDDDVSLIYTGTIRTSVVRRMGANIIIDITALTGFLKEKEPYNDWFLPGTRLDKVCKTVAEKMQLRVIDTNIKIDGVVGFRGLVQTGTCKIVLDSLAKIYGFSWSNQDEEIIVIDDNLYLNAAQNVEKSSIIKVSQIYDNNQENGLGVQVKTTLNSLLKIGNGFRFNSALNPQLSSTNYKCYKITHSGDTYSSLWQTTVIGYQPGFSYFYTKKNKDILL